MNESMHVAERLAAIGEEFATIDATEMGAIFYFLAVLHGASDAKRMGDLAEIAERFAQEQALVALNDEEKAKPEQQLEQFVQEGIDLAYHAMRERKWAVAVNHLAKLAYLDDLIIKVKAGEVLPVDSWPEIVGCPEEHGCTSCRACEVSHCRICAPCGKPEPIPRHTSCSSCPDCNCVQCGTAESGVSNA